MNIFPNDLMLWITAVDLPALGGLFWLVWRIRREYEISMRHLRNIVETRNSQMREALSGFKLEVAKNYASISDIKELENRLIGHLLRIEAKLDTTALKTEALRGTTKDENA